MNTLETVEHARAVVKNRLNDIPDFELFLSAERQLQYLMSILKREEDDRSRLKDIIIGHFAVREFLESDPELAQALMGAQHIASKMAQGLKV